MNCVSTEYKSVLSNLDEFLGKELELFKAAGFQNGLIADITFLKYYIKHLDLENATLSPKTLSNHLNKLRHEICVLTSELKKQEQKQQFKEKAIQLLKGSTIAIGDAYIVLLNASDLAYSILGSGGQAMSGVIGGGIIEKIIGDILPE